MPPTGTLGLVLAGGRSTRMGGRDKALVTLAGETLLARAVAGLAPQVDTVAINSNAPAGQFSASARPVLPDLLPGFAGPLAGIHAGLTRFPDAPLVVVAVDLAFLPKDLVTRLQAGLGPARCSYASAGNQHALAILFPPGMAKVVQEYLASGGRSLKDFLAIHGTPVVFDRPQDRGLFMNLNTPQDLARAEQELANK